MLRCVQKAGSCWVGLVVEFGGRFGVGRAAAAAAAGIGGVAVWVVRGAILPCRERSRSAVDCADDEDDGGGIDWLGVWDGGGGAGIVGIMPFLDRAATRSTPVRVGAAAAWFCTFCSCV